MYFHGYATGDPNKRMRGGLAYIGFFTALISTVMLAVANIKHWKDGKVTPALK